MKRNLFFVLTLVLMNHIIVFEQQVEVEGQLKVTTINQNNASTDVLVKNADGTIGKRSAFTIEKQGTAVGDMKYWNGSQWIIIPVGSPGQIMKVSNSGIPSWQNNSQTHIIIQGNITNAQAAAKIASEAGSNTQYVWIQNTTNLTSINLDVLQTLAELKIQNNTALVDVSINNLAYVSNAVEINNNQNLTSLNFLALSSSNAYININNNTSITNITFTVLTLNNGNIDITNNATLNYALFPSLTQSNKLRIMDAPNLTNISLPVLSTVPNYLTFARLNNLNSIIFPSLVSINEIFSCSENNTLATVSFPSLSNMGGYMIVEENPALTSLNMPVLATYTSGFFRCGINAFPSSEINELLATFVALGSTPLSSIRLEDQNPPAPPTGQGIVDSNTLIGLGKSVITD